MHPFLEYSLCAALGSSSMAVVAIGGDNFSQLYWKSFIRGRPEISPPIAKGITYHCDNGFQLNFVWFLFQIVSAHLLFVRSVDEGGKYTGPFRSTETASSDITEWFV